MTGKNIHIFLVDGCSTGLMIAEIMNWTGKVIVAPRARLDELAARDEVKSTGVYLLVGPSPNTMTRDCVYVGESDNVLSRITGDHEKTKDFWVKVVFVVSKDENITKAHARYLESRLISVIASSGRADLSNGTQPPTPSLPEADISDMEYFLEQIKIILPVLGMTFLQPKPNTAEQGGAGAGSPLFVLRQGDISASAREINNEFVVLKGSLARIEGVKSWDSYVKLRDQLVSEEKLLDSGKRGLYVFADDVSFSSPSAAAACVLARNSNGRIEWKTEETGTTYQKWYNDRLEQLLK
jgi:hypothetical protein